MASEDLAQHPIRLALDLVAGGTVVGSMVGALPALAGVLSIVWFLIQIYESKTYQRFVIEWARRRKVRRLRRLRALSSKLGVQITSALEPPSSANE